MIFVLCLTSQGTDGVRGLKGGKGEKVSDIVLFLSNADRAWNDTWQITIQCCSFSSDSFHYMSSSLNVPQGEDGFPGAKGDMGIKGDQVSTARPKNHFHLDIQRLKIKFPLVFLPVISATGW